MISGQLAQFWATFVCLFLAISGCFMPSNLVLRCCHREGISLCENLPRTWPPVSSPTQVRRAILRVLTWNTKFPAMAWMEGQLPNFDYLRTVTSLRKWCEHQFLHRVLTFLLNFFPWLFPSFFPIFQTIWHKTVLLAKMVFFSQFSTQKEPKYKITSDKKGCSFQQQNYSFFGIFETLKTKRHSSNVLFFPLFPWLFQTFFVFPDFSRIWPKCPFSLTGKGLSKISRFSRPGGNPAYGMERELTEIATVSRSTKLPSTKVQWDCSPSLMPQ